MSRLIWQKDPLPQNNELVITSNIVSPSNPQYFDSLSTGHDSTLRRLPAVPESDHELLCQKRIHSQLMPNDFFRKELNSLDQVIGSWYYLGSNIDRVDIETSTPGKFMLALARANLLEGRTLEQDDKLALALLNEVIEEDPNNSSPLLYAAIIEDRAGNHQRAQQLLKQSMSTNRFDSYVLMFSKTIFSRVQSAADLLQALNLWAQIPVPNYMVLWELLKNNNLHYIARQLMVDGLRSHHGIAEIDWLPLEYNIGRALINRAQAEIQYPTYVELFNLHKSPLRLNEVNDVVHSSCDVSSLDPMVNSLQTHFAQSLHNSTQGVDISP